MTLKLVTSVVLAGLVAGCSTGGHGGECADNCDTAGGGGSAQGGATAGASGQGGQSTAGRGGSSAAGQGGTGTMAGSGGQAGATAGAGGAGGARQPDAGTRDGGADAMPVALDAGAKADSAAPDAGNGVSVGDPGKPWNFLWVGNSFTFNSGAAGKTKELINRGQTTVTINKADLSVNWYRGLYYHWNFGDNVGGGNTRELIKSKTYSHIVLQDFMLHPTAKAEINMTTGEGTYGLSVSADYSKRFIDEIRANGQIPIVWSIWPEQNQQADFEALILAYKKIADDNRAVFVPASGAWFLALKERPGLALWDSDKFHPSGMGGYACSLVFYAVLTGKSPVGNPYVSDNIDAATARFLQEKAWQAYQMYGSRTNLGP